MKVYTIKCYWRYDDEPEIIAITDESHIDEAINNHKAKFEVIMNAIIRYDSEEYILNEIN